MGSMVQSGKLTRRAIKWIILPSPIPNGRIRSRLPFCILSAPTKPWRLCQLLPFLQVPLFLSRSHVTVSARLS